MNQKNEETSKDSIKNIAWRLNRAIAFIKLNLTQLLICAIAITCFSAAVSAQTERLKVESVFTDISKNNCKDEEPAIHGNGTLLLSKCQGVAGNLIEITYLEHGQWIALISPAGKRFFIDLFTSSGEESYIREKIEWRGSRKREGFKPSAMIFEHRVFKRANPDGDPEIKIAVVHIKSGSACLVADGVSNKKFGMKEARQFADRVNMPCLSESDVNPQGAQWVEYSSVKKMGANLFKWKKLSAI